MCIRDSTGTRSLWAASDLKMSMHFEEECIESYPGLVQLIQTFLNGIIHQAKAPPLDERCIEVELLHLTADMLESSLMLEHGREGKKVRVCT